VRTTTITMDKVGLLQLPAKAQADLASYQAHEEQAAKHQAAAMAELDAIATRTSGRNQALQMAGQTVRQLQEDLDQARVRSSLAAGTLAAGTDEASTKDLEKRLARAQKELDQLRTRTAKEDQADQEQATTVQTQSDRHLNSIATLQQYQASLITLIAETKADIGECEQREILAHVHKLESELAAQLSQVEQLRAELDDFADEAKERLADWPDLLQKTLPHLAYRDDVTVVLESAVGFVTTCLGSGRNAAAHIDSACFRGLPWGDLFALLAFERDDYHGFLRGSVEPEILQDRKKALEKVLAVYREMKR